MTESGKYGATHYDVLLAQMLRSGAVAELAVARIEGHHFPNPIVGGTHLQGVIFTIIKLYYEQYQKSPDKAVIYTEVNSFLSKHYATKPDKKKALEDCLGQFFIFMDLVDARSEPMARKLVQYISDLCVVRPALNQLLDETHEIDGLRGIGERILALDEHRMSIGGSRTVTGVLDLDLENIGERMTTCIPWLDARFGGGAGPVTGCTMGIIAPQGCGKTSMGISLGVQQALVCRHVLLVLAEEGLTLSTRSKIIGAALNIEHELIARAPGSTFSAKVTHALNASGKKTMIELDDARKRLKNLEAHLHVLDLVKCPGTVEVIDAELHKLENEGKRPLYVYVDWAGILAAKSMAENNRINKEQEIKRVVYSLNESSQRTNSIVAISQQMAAAAVARGPFAANDHYCAADCKGFGEPMKYVFVINPREPKLMVSLFIVAKSRDDAPGDNLVIKLRGEYPRFDNVSDDYSVTGNFRYKRKSPGASRVPVESA